MRLEAPLANLIRYCQAICVAECCGAEAFDFHPIHIASFLLLYRGVPDPADIATMRGQLETLRSEYGTNGSCSIGVTLDEMNQIFSGADVDQFVSRILANLDRALRVIDEVDGTLGPAPTDKVRHAPKGWCARPSLGGGNMQ